MKAVAIYQYGSADVLQYQEIAKPKIRPDELLVNIHATTVNPIDWKIRKGMFRLLTGNKFPMILGFDLAGEVVEVGSQVTDFKPGDQIFGNIGLPGGTYAEYAAVPAKFVTLKPANMTYEQAAAVPGSALAALQALRDRGRIQTGQSVLVNGASGGVGSFAVQIAKALGAEVTATCSTKNIELVQSLGADRVIDYTQQDFAQKTEQNTAQYDIIFDAVGKRSFSSCKHVLKLQGIYITTLPNANHILHTILTALLPGKKARSILQVPSGKDLVFLKELIEAGKMRVAIDRIFPLSEIAAAHTYSETEHAAGKIVVTP